MLLATQIADVTPASTLAQGVARTSFSICHTGDGRNCVVDGDTT